MILLLIGCAHVPLPEHMVFHGKEGIENWRILDYENFNSGGFVHYYAPPDTKDGKSWLQLLTKGIEVGADISLEKYVADSIAAYKTNCPGTTHKIIEADAYNLYYTNSYPCRGHQSEVTRIAKGNEGLYRLSYTIRGRDLTQNEIEEWLKVFRAAYVAKGDQHERVR